jgi:TetR/AcrR family acrAB operon transcriptional repressor
MTKRRAQAEQTRTGILDAAEESFARAGFERTRLEDVARAVGVRRGAIFHYFRGKRELYEAVLSRCGCARPWRSGSRCRIKSRPPC